MLKVNQDIGKEIVQADTPPTPIVSESKIGKITLHDCEDVHVGPKFFDSTVTIVKDSDKSRIINVVVVIGVAILLLLIVVALLVTSLGERKFPPEPPSPEPPSPEPPTQVPPTLPPDPPTDQPTPPTAGPGPPDPWLIPYQVWSRQPPPDCVRLVTDDKGNKGAWTISVDSLDDCEDMNAVQSLSGIRFNFYLVQSGAAFEGLGWYCAPEYGLTYSRTGVAIAVCGPLNPNQETVLDLLIQAGVEGKHLADDYNVIPECCRGFVGRRGPGRDLDLFLVKKYTSHEERRFLNPSCANDYPCVKY